MELKKKIAAEVEEERQQKAEREALAEAERYKAEMNKQEETERREALIVGKRTDPQVKQLDALVLQLQQEEENCSTKYLDWRNDLFEAVRSCESEYNLRVGGRRGRHCIACSTSAPRRANCVFVCSVYRASVLRNHNLQS